MRPQLGSPPCSAVFTSGDVAMACAASLASRSVFAPRDVELHDARRAFAVANDHPGEVAADGIERALKIGEVGVRVTLPSFPEAISSTVSLVEVSPSTEIELKLWSTAILQRALERDRIERGIRHHEAEHGGHVGMNHARAFGDADDASALAAESERRPA